jgi:HEAT repeat protein
VLALSLLGAAKTRVAIPAIGLVLKDPRERVAESAADALVAIGDESAVPILIGAIRRNDVRSEVRAIEAISRIGGKEARAYLEMTAFGHENSEVRALSQNALARMPSEGSKDGSKTR